MLTAIAALVLTQGPGTPAPVYRQFTTRVQFLVAEQKVDWKAIHGKMKVIEKPGLNLPDRVLLFTGTREAFAGQPSSLGNKPGQASDEKPLFTTISSPVMRSLAGMPAVASQSLPNERGASLQISVSQNSENPFLFDVVIGFDPEKRDAQTERAFPFSYKASISSSQTIVLGFPTTDASVKDQVQAISLSIAGE